jgi:hypothetical protein
VVAVSKRLDSMMMSMLSVAELRNEQRILLKNIGRSSFHGFEWKFSTERLDAVNRELARR